MKPKTQQIVEGLSIAVAIVGVLILWDIFSEKIPADILDKMDNMMVYGTIGISFIIGIGAVLFLYSNFFTEIYIQDIMHRASNLLDVSITPGEKYLYVVADCLQSADDASQSYFIYIHYLIEIETGKKLKYKSKKSPREDSGALEYFKKQLNENLQLNFNSDGFSGKKIEKGIYVVHFVPFKSRFDFGFKIICAEKDRKNIMWERKI